MINPECLDPREVLAHLNALGYYDITAQQLKDFIHDLTKLIKYEQKLATRATSQCFDVKPTDSPEPPYPPESAELEELPESPESAELEELPESPELAELVESPECPEFADLADLAESPEYPEFAELPESHFNECLCYHPHTQQPSENLDHSPEESYYESSTESSSTTATYTASHIKPSSRNQVESEYTQRYHTSFIRAWNLQGCKDLSSRGKKNLDPVRLYHQYKEYWKRQSIPGEDRHLDLRWDIRNRMVGVEPSPRVCI